MTDKNQKKSAREIALNVLMEITEKGNFSHTVLNRFLNEYQYFSKQDRAFITRLCEGTLERLITLDYILDQYSTVKVKKMKPVIRNLLRMSLYQIKYMDQVPDSAACNESGKIAKQRGFANLSGFVNGILRNIVRNQKAFSLPMKKMK
ncbi:MAG: hypothetical protein ACFWTJ_03850 [Lachnoclostridium sp.]